MLCLTMLCGFELYSRWVPLFVDIRSFGLDRVVVKLFFFGVSVYWKLKKEKSMVHLWNDRDPHDLIVRRLDFWEGGNDLGPHN